MTGCELSRCGYKSNAESLKDMIGSDNDRMLRWNVGASIPIGTLFGTILTYWVGLHQNSLLSRALRSLTRLQTPVIFGNLYVRVRTTPRPWSSAALDSVV